MPFKNVIKHFSELDKSKCGKTEYDKTTARLRKYSEVAFREIEGYYSLARVWKLISHPLLTIQMFYRVSIYLHLPCLI
jgi:hypothetical protein